MPIFQAWVTIAEQIDCPAPLPEDLETPLLTKMLFLAPYEVPEKKAKKAAKGTRDGLRRKGASNVTSEDAETHSSTEDDEGVEEKTRSPLTGGKEKRKASIYGEAEAFKKGKISLPDYSAAANSSGDWEPRAKPMDKS